MRHFSVSRMRNAKRRSAHRWRRNHRTHCQGSRGLKRMDFKETNPYLRSLSRFPCSRISLSQAAERKAQPGVGMDAFPGQQRAFRGRGTCLVTNTRHDRRPLADGNKARRSKTSQPFLKIALPRAQAFLNRRSRGEKVKPVEAPDGNRVRCSVPASVPRIPKRVFCFHPFRRAFLRKKVAPIFLSKNGHSHRFIAVGKFFSPNNTR